ncbi:hypothetical protein SNARM312S_01498 [Streptomyces narbonensis]
MTGAKTATRMRKTTTKAPARASLSRFSRVQAICQGERPWIALVSVPELSGVPGASGVPTTVAVDSPALVSCSGAVIVVRTPLGRG